MKVIDLAAIIGLRRPDRKVDALLHEVFIILVFCAFTTLLTFPYINHLRNAVVDPGDPYLVSWILWWDYHQTFTDPLNLFHANIFYPLRYTLAFSEHCYGIALLFFPLFAFGLRPLTVHATAMYFGFVLCGYGAFRLARTLTGSEGVGWVAGIIFAFVPYRFHLMSLLVYLFTPWIPLLFESLVLFAWRQSWKRAAWLGVAFLMTGLSSLSLWTLALVPFAFFAVVLLTRYQLWRARVFWIRAAVALGLASVALVPFVLPYYFVSKLYGFKRSVDEVKANSAWPVHWLSVENRNKLWNGMGVNLPEGNRFKLFPGLLPIVLSMVAVVFVGPSKPFGTVANRQKSTQKRWLGRLDVLILGALVLSILAIGFDRSDYFYKFFTYVTLERVLSLLTVAIIARLCISYPTRLRFNEHVNLVETLRSEGRSDAFWLGLLLTIIGFCYSIGWNFFFYRICYDLIPMFRSMRFPARGAMFAYLGLALLAGLGVQRLAELAIQRQSRLRPAAVFAIVCVLLLAELNAAPLKFLPGDVDPDAVTWRLKETPMRGGLVVLPVGGDYNHRHMLRSADHQKQLIVATSGFDSPYEDQIELATQAGAIEEPLVTLLEKIPASYVVVQNHLIPPERRVDYENFLARAVASDRLRFVNRFDGRDDLYAVVKTEPQATTEAALPFKLEVRDWGTLLKDNPANLLGQYRSWSQTVYRFYVASFGQIPRYSEFMLDVEAVGRGVMTSASLEQPKLQANLNEFAKRWVQRPKFLTHYETMTSEHFVDQLSANAGTMLAPSDRASFINELNSGAASRDRILLAMVQYPRFVENEDIRSLVLLHYFGYLRRNPDDPPDNNLDGFIYWIKGLEKSRDTSQLARAFLESWEYQKLDQK
jgi:hypothetical protein